jgi:Family of unknown function (DUF6518)
MDGIKDSTPEDEGRRRKAERQMVIARYLLGFTVVGNSVAALVNGLEGNTGFAIFWAALALIAVITFAKIGSWLRQHQHRIQKPTGTV